MPEQLSVPVGLSREIEALKQMLSGSGSGHPPRDLLQDAVRLFREAGELSNLSMARSVCYGSAIRFGQLEPPLIEGATFRQLLLKIDEYRKEPRRYRRCYRGLLHTYFVYDGEAAPEIGQRNWTYLRLYLEQYRRAIRAEGVTQIGSNRLMTTRTCYLKIRLAGMVRNCWRARLRWSTDFAPIWKLPMLRGWLESSCGHR